jgi:hypothetical protein
MHEVYIASTVAAKITDMVRADITVKEKTVLEEVCPEVSVFYPSCRLTIMLPPVGWCAKDSDIKSDRTSYIR